MAQGQALTGFLAGFNEQREAEQQLENSRVLNEYRASEALKNFHEIQSKGALRGDLAKIFLEEPPSSAEGPPQHPGFERTRKEIVPLHPAEDPRDEVVDVTEPVPPSELEDYRKQNEQYQKREQRRKEEFRADQLDKAAAASAAAGDSQRAVAYTNAAAGMRAKHSHIDAEQQRIQGLLQQQAAARRESQASALGAIQDQATYPDGYRTYLQRGGAPIPGLTGDWEKDKPRIQFHADATMKPQDQNRAEINRQQVARQLAEDQARAERSKAELAVAAENARTAQQRAETARQAQIAQARRNDEQAAQTQARLDAARELHPDDVRMANGEMATLLAGMENAPRLSDATKGAIVKRAAERAKIRLSNEDGTNFGTLVRQELERELKTSVERRIWAFPDWMGGGQIPLPNKIQPESRLGPPPPPIGGGTRPRPGQSGAGTPTPTPTPTPAAPGASTQGPTRAQAAALEEIRGTAEPAQRTFMRKEFQRKYGYDPLPGE